MLRSMRNRAFKHAVSAQNTGDANSTLLMYNTYAPRCGLRATSRIPGSVCLALSRHLPEPAPGRRAPNDSAGGAATSGGVNVAAQGVTATTTGGGRLCGITASLLGVDNDNAAWPGMVTGRGALQHMAQRRS